MGTMTIKRAKKTVQRKTSKQPTCPNCGKKTLTGAFGNRTYCRRCGKTFNKPKSSFK